MKKLRKTFRESKFTAVLLVLFGLHFLSIHGIAENLIYCYENDGRINIESKVDSIFTIPSEDIIHAEEAQKTAETTYTVSGANHFDVSFSLLCSKKQHTMRFNQQRIVKVIDGILDTMIEQLAPSRVFRHISFIPALIENLITTSLQTVVLLN